MKELIQKNWWSVALRGLLLAIFGGIVLAMSDAPVADLMMYLGSMFLVTGVIYVIAGVSFFRRLKNWITLICIGGVDIFIGLYALFSADQANRIFTSIVGGWGVLIGAFIAVLAIPYKKYRIILLVNAVISLALGIVILMHPLEPQAMNLLVGIYTVVLGVIIIYFGFRLKNYNVNKIRLVIDKDPETGLDPEKPGEDLPDEPPVI